jgi:hypothetical protein
MKKNNNKSRLVKITKEQYNRIFASGLIKESLDTPIDGEYVEYYKDMGGEEPFELNGKKFQYVWAIYPNGKKDIGVYAFGEDRAYAYNVFASRYNINEEQTPKIKGGLNRVDKTFKQTFANDNVKLTEVSTDDNLKQEVEELIKFFYRKSDKLTPFWSENNLSYDEFCDNLLNKKIIIKKDGLIELSKSLGSSENAKKTLEDELRNLLNDNKSEVNEGDWFDNSSNNPSNRPDPVYNKGVKIPNPSFNVIGYNGEFALVQGNGGMYVFYYDNIDKSEFEEYADKVAIDSYPSGDGGTDYDYSDDWDIDDEVLENYINDNLKTIKIGKGLAAWESGEYNLVLIDDELKEELLYMYDKDPMIIKYLGSVNENSGLGDDYEIGMDAMSKFKDTVRQGFSPNRTEKSPEDKEAILAKIRDIRAKELASRETLNQLDLDEMTGTASAGAFTTGLSMEPMKKDSELVPNDVPVVRESMELGEGYTHFAIFKSDGNIATGWDYSELYDEYEKAFDNQSIKEYSKEDLRNDFPENRISDFKLVTRKVLEKNGVNPKDSNNWYKINMNEATTTASAGNFQYDANALPGINRDGSFKQPKKSKAQKKTQWAGGAFVEFNDCTKLNNKPAGSGCSTGAVDNVVKLKKTKGNINAPSLNESIMYEALKLQHDKQQNRLLVISDLEGRQASQETFSNKAVLKQNGFLWTGTHWAIPSDKLEQAKKTLSLINKAEYIIDKLEDLEAAVEESSADNKDLLKARLDQYISDLANATDEAALSAEIRRYLTFFSKFHSYSYYNRMLIFIQKPDATKVASYKKWQSKFRQVNKGAKAITVLAPIISKNDNLNNPEGEEDNEDFKINRNSDIRGYKAVKVFDISDTSPVDERGEVPDEPQWWGENTPSETADMLYGAVVEVAADLGIKVTQSDAKGGEKGFSAGDHINISSDVSGAGRLSTMIHEIAHELMHWKKSSIYYIDNGNGRESYALGELQAESVSYVVLKHYGIPVTHHATYLALWKANKEKIQSNLEIISKVSQFIIDKIDKQISQSN